MTSIYAIAPTRPAGAWTRSTPSGKPLGKLHAAWRVNGALEPDALCGLRLPARSLSARPFVAFEVDHPRVCIDCAAKAVEELR